MKFELSCKVNERRGDMSNELDYLLTGKVTFYKNGSDDPEWEGNTIIEIVETDNGAIEIAFDVNDGRKRVYLKFNKTLMIKAIKAYEAGT